MKKTKKAVSIIEAMIVILIVTTWIVWTYNIFFESSKLIDSTANRLLAIEIAKEGIEAVTNIRDTNWIILWADYENCWNTFNYNVGCVWNTWIGTDIPAWSYIIYSDINNKWQLISKLSWIYWNPVYNSDYVIWLTWSWFYTQSWVTIGDLKPLFTREIKISYIETTIPPDAIPDSNDEKMKIISLVQWRDSSWNNIHKVELESIISNWKNKK